MVAVLDISKLSAIVFSEFVPIAAYASAVESNSIQLWRLDCGEILLNDASPLADNGVLRGQRRMLSNSCYLIRHNRHFLLWDAGLSMSFLGRVHDDNPVSATLARSLPSQLAEIGVQPNQIDIIAISHYHFDHVGQAGLFPQARLLISERDWAALGNHRTPFGSDRDALAHWLDGHGKVEQIRQSLEIFKDGSVIVLNLPGHTPREQALLVKLPQTGPVILTGDVAHLEQQLIDRNIPTWNTDRVASLKSMGRLVGIANRFHAKIIVPHDPGDVSKLALFPAASQ
ncbi:N-acyl homoserine lactonase family protein [Chelatococcus asaccharovorans]|uniref:N-acyl homoserine lactonase family protein n=1 Tax=Chelatococcus asaccharovorans TaxID=28210 RepID=UPI00226469ED|nr:N-acyl homoserine lactonase family protein [Chelatococcus asaccharovorans]